MLYASFLAFLIGQQQPMSSAAAAQAVALADLQQQGAEAPFCRYVWHTDATDVKRVAWALRALADPAPPLDYMPVVIQVGPIRLTRVNLRVYWSRKESLQRAIDAWELLTFDPNFSILISGQTLALASGESGKLPDGVQEFNPKTGRMLVKCKPYKYEGETFDERWVNVVRFPARHLNPIVQQKLQELTVSAAPVVRGDYFLMRGLATIQEDGLFRDLFGGLYYDFKGIRTAKSEEKATDFEVFLTQYGVIETAEGGLKRLQAFHEREGGDQLLGMDRSKVTDKTRFVLIIPTRKTVRFRGVMLITIDFKDKSIDLSQFGFANMDPYELLRRCDAMEIILVGDDGSQIYAMFKGGAKVNGKEAADAFSLQREVPFDVANDSTIPRPGTQRLQTTGCITCHGRAGGWQPVPNHLTQLFAKGGVAPIADADAKNKDQFDVLARLKRLTAGNADDLLADLNRGLANTSLLTVGRWHGQDVLPGQTNSYVLTAKAIEEARNRYWYSDIDASGFLLDLGVEYDEGKGMEKFNQLFPPLEPGKPRPAHADPIFEDTRIGMLRAGLRLTRAQAEQIKSFAADRIWLQKRAAP